MSVSLQAELLFNCCNGPALHLLAAAVHRQDRPPASQEYPHMATLCRLEGRALPFMPSLELRAGHWVNICVNSARDNQAELNPLCRNGRAESAPALPSICSALRPGGGLGRGSSRGGAVRARRRVCRGEDLAADRIEKAEKRIRGVSREERQTAGAEAQPASQARRRSGRRAGRVNKEA